MIAAAVLAALLVLAPAAPHNPCVAISHRAGASPTTDENTVEAVTRSASFGAWSEVDVRVLADGKLVLFHDNSWNHKTTGSGVVEETVWADVSGFRTLPNMQAIPTFAAAARVARQQGVRLVAELKHRWAWSGDTYAKAAAIADKGNVYLGGTEGVLNDLAAEAPGAPVFWRPDADQDPTDASRYSADLVLAFVRNITTAQVDELTSAGVRVGVRQTDDPDQWAAAIRKGAGYVTTNQPAAFGKGC